MKNFTKIISFAITATVSSLAHMAQSAPNSSQFTAAPPFVAEVVGKPNVVIALDISGSMKATAYADPDQGRWSDDDTLHQDFNPLTSYFGYFDSSSTYRYDDTESKQFFVEDNVSGEWDGNFLNWLTMRRMDVARKVLTGGKVRERDGEVLDAEPSWYVIQGQNEPFDRTFRKSHTTSSLYTPDTYPDGTIFLISDGKITANTSITAKSLALSEGVEIGMVSTDRDTSDDIGSPDDADWVSVSFVNTYATPPAVVITGLSFYSNSTSPHARVRNVTASGFEVRVEKWNFTEAASNVIVDNSPDLGTVDITYIVVDDDAAQTIEIDGDTYEVRAGKLTTQDTLGDPQHWENQSFFSNGYTPVIFAGVSSQNSSRPVITRLRNTHSAGFDVALQNEEYYWTERLTSLPAPSSHPAAEEIHWVAMEPFSAPGIEVGTADGIQNGWADVSFGGDIFSDTPILAVQPQTANEVDTADALYRNLSNTDVQLRIREEKSDGSGRSHNAEQIGYLAVEYSDGYNIHIGVRTEPQGIIQENSGSIRFGLAVYNYDHNLDPASIYSGNRAHGGTFRPCYPNISLSVEEQTNFDICLDTHVKSPLSNIVDVIEDHPLLWGATPIAETLYEIKSYFAQTDHTASHGHVQWYDNGTEGLSGERSSYEVNNDWDPYYYDEFSNRLPCAKSFVLHFNDGAPVRDFDDDGIVVHPTVIDDGIGNFGPQQVLDDLALELRNTDCRDESGTEAQNTGTDGLNQMTGHQEIVTYYVYAALGEEEESNDDLLRMRESAANGGFVDSNGDNAPNPNHNPLGGTSDLNDYIDAGVCASGYEWDSNEDCNPDTFYFANDGAELVEELNAAFESIVTRAATGGASSVISASRSGEGAVVNAIFRPFISSGGDSVSWIGDVHALMIDDAGNIRQDNGNQTLEDASSDPYLDMCADDEEQLVRVKTSTTLALRPTATQSAACTEAVFPLDLFDVEYLWSGATWLTNLTDSEVTTQRNYADTGPGRYIITGIDSNNDGIVQEAESVSFESINFPEAYAGLLSDTESNAQEVIRYIRGEDITGYRPRQLDGNTMRLGDVIYSTPTIVGRPAENLDLLYQSESYALFFERYKYRRQVSIAGANDGMLHAFNAGWYDAETRQLLNAHGTAEGSATNYDLGAELWAYIPYNALPHLDYLMEPNYGSISSDHISFVDLEPRIFDAKIFPRSDPNATDSKYPGLEGDAYGWGTVLVVGMRLGGGETTTDIDLSAGTVDERTLKSSIAIFDITDPDDPPRLLLEFTHAQLGFTTAVPAPITVGTNSEGDGDWYLLVGSGADTDREGFTDVESTQNGTLFLIDLKDVADQEATILETSFGTGGVLSLAEANSFISEITPVDFGLDNFTTDTVYFGTVSGSDDTAWDGNLYRMRIQNETQATPLPVSSWAPEIMIDAQAPVTAPISPASDSFRNRWVFFGTGRYFTNMDNADTTTQNYYYGLKEPRDTGGNFTYGTVATSDIVDVTSIEVATATGALTPAPSGFSTGTTVSEMEAQMRQFTDSEAYLAGWQRTLRTSERNFGAATVLGGTLTFTSFIPEVEECSVDGNAYLYVINALTGTAAEQAIITQDDSATTNEFIIDIGSSPATSPSIHRGEGYSTDNRSTAIIQTSGGNIISVEQDNQDTVRDGEASWRQLR